MGSKRCEKCADCTRPNGHTGRCNHNGTGEGPSGAPEVPSTGTRLSDDLVAALTTVCDHLGIRHEASVIDGIQGRLIHGPGGKCVLVTLEGTLRPVQISLGTALSL